MAKYIRINLSTPGAATGSELLINIDQITRIATGSTTTTDIFFDNVQTATKKWRLTDTMSRGLNIPCGCAARKTTLNKLFPYK